jgi:hypothetical protein
VEKEVRRMTWPRSLSKCPFCGYTFCPEEGGCGCVESEMERDEEDLKEDKEGD